MFLFRKFLLITRFFLIVEVLKRVSEPSLLIIAVVAYKMLEKIIPNLSVV